MTEKTGMNATLAALLGEDCIKQKHTLHEKFSSQFYADDSAPRGLYKNTLRCQALYVTAGTQITVSIAGLAATLVRSPLRAASTSF